jgi:hypothetical protein
MEDEIVFTFEDDDGEEYDVDFTPDPELTETVH